MGTGFIAYALNGKDRKRIAGWGQFFDEGGSGYTIGRDAITAALCAIDGSGMPTMLTSLFEQRLCETAAAHLAGVGDIGAHIAELPEKCAGTAFGFKSVAHSFREEF